MLPGNVCRVVSESSSRIGTVETSMPAHTGDAHRARTAPYPRRSGAGCETCRRPVGCSALGLPRARACLTGTHLARRDGRGFCFPGPREWAREVRVHLTVFRLARSGAASVVLFTLSAATATTVDAATAVATFNLPAPSDISFATSTTFGPDGLLYAY